MANKKEIKLRKLKKSYVGGSLIAFICVGIIVFCAFAGMLAVFGLYITDSCGYLLYLLLTEKICLVQENKVAELDLVNDKIDDIALVGVVLHVKLA